MHDEKPTAAFFVGFVVSTTGICLISFNGNTVLALNPLGDLLAVLAATRRIFTYGILFMLPVLFRFEGKVQRFTNPVNLFNILFIGLDASALCFVTWNTAVKRSHGCLSLAWLFPWPDYLFQSIEDIPSET